MPKNDHPKSSGRKTAPDGKSNTPKWQDLNKGPAKGQRQAKHARTLRVPGKGSGR